MKRRAKERGIWIGVGAALGAGLMALMDPGRGRRRRAFVRDKATSTARKVGQAAGKTWRDLSHRAEAVASEARRVARDGPVSDEVPHPEVREEAPDRSADAPEAPAETPPARKRPATTRRRASGPTVGEDQPTQGITLKEE